MNLFDKPKKKGFKHSSTVHLCVSLRGACIRRWQRIFPSPLFPAFPPLQKWGGGGKGRVRGREKRELSTTIYFYVRPAKLSVPWWFIHHWVEMPFFLLFKLHFSKVLMAIFWGSTIRQSKKREIICIFRTRKLKAVLIAFFFLPQGTWTACILKYALGFFFV